MKSRCGWNRSIRSARRSDLVLAVFGVVKFIPDPLDRQRLHAGSGAAVSRKSANVTTGKLKDAFSKQDYTLNPNTEKRSSFSEYYNDLVYP